MKGVINMREIEGVRRINMDGSAVLDIQVSEASDLPALGDTFYSFVVASGTIAQIVKRGVYATLNDDGKYYDEDGTEVTAEEEVEEVGE